MSRMAWQGMGMGPQPGPGRWDPWHDIQREVGRLFDRFESALPTWRFARPFPAVNLYDAGDRFLLTAELPGMTADQFDLSITGESLVLQGERKRPEGVAEESYRRQERPFGRWERAITLPERIASAGVTAEFTNGVLTISLPKAEEAKPRHIPVSAAGLAQPAPSSSPATPGRGASA